MPSPRNRKGNAKSKKAEANDPQSSSDNTSKNGSKASNSSTKSKKKNAKQHGLAAQDQIHRSRRNYMLIAVLLYIGIGAGVLLWKGMAKLPEIPPELESEILGSYPQQLKDIDMPKNMKKKSSDPIAKDKKSETVDGNKASATHSSNKASEVKSSALKPTIAKANSSIKQVGVFDDYLSSATCDGIIRKHDARLKELKSIDPIICFNSKAALSSHMKNLNENWANRIFDTVKNLKEGIVCLNATLSSQLKSVSWSHSTSYFGSEHEFLALMDETVKQNYLNFDRNLAGKIQTVSYGKDVKRQDSEKCREDLTGPKPWFTFLIFLATFEEGGSAEFPDVGISAKSRKGRAILWSHMNVTKKDNALTVIFDPSSFPVMPSIKEGTNYIFQRRYYDPFEIEKLSSVSKLPAGLPKSTPYVMCGAFECGSCWWYDEWRDKCFELKNTSDYRFKYNFNINRISYFAGCQVFKDELLDFYVP